MKATVSEVGVFAKCFLPGVECPCCHGEAILLITDNEWKQAASAAARCRTTSGRSSAVLCGELLF